MIEQLRLKVFSPWGEQIGYITDLLNATWVATLNDHSTLEVTVHAGGRSDEMLSGPVEVALEVMIDGAWGERHNCRFFSAGESSDEVKSAATRKVEFLGISQCMRWASVWDFSPDDENGKRKFSAQSPGSILHTLFAEARRRTDGGLVWAPTLAWTFNASRDSAGRSWGRNANPSFVPSASFEKVLEWLSSKGAIDWRTLRREIQVYAAGTEMNRTLDDVRFRAAFATAAPVSTSYENLTTYARFRGENGKTWGKAAGAPFTAFGRIERWSEHGQVSLDPTAQLYLDEVLIKGAQPDAEFRREWESNQNPAQPTLWEDYFLGDWVISHDGTHRRVVEVGLSLDESGKITGWETLGTRIQEILERLARKTTDLSDGMVGGENSPITLNIPSAKPAAPTGLVASSDGYWKDGRQRSRVRAGWSAVSKDTRGRHLLVSHYEANIAGRIAKTPQLYADVDGVGAGVDVRVEVRAVSSDGVLSEPAHITITTARPEERLSPPTQLTASCSDGIVTVSWDGKLKYSNGAMVDPPKHFDRVDLYQSVSSSGHGVLVGTLTAGSAAFDRTPNIGQTLYFYGVAVDTDGGESTPGQRGSVQVASSTRVAVAQAQARADQAALAAEGARETAQSAVVKSDAAGLRAQEAFNKAVDAVGAAAPLGGVWPAEWVKDREVSATDAGFVIEGNPSGVANHVRIMSGLKTLTTGRTYRADFTVFNDSASPVSMAAGFYYHNANGGWVASVWGRPRVTIPAGETAVISNDITVKYPAGTAYVRAVLSGDKDAQGQRTVIMSGSLVDVTALKEVNGSVLEAVSQVQQAANLKNKITRSASSPSSTSGFTSGDVWWRYGNTSLTGAITGQWVFSGSAWVESKIGHEVVASVSTDALVAGSAQINTAVINQLVTDSHFAQRMAANAVTVHAAQNLWTGTWGGGLPGGFTGGVGWATGVDDPGDRGAYRLEGTKLAQGEENFAEVIPGEEYVFEAVVGAHKPDSRLYVELRDDKGAHCADCYPLTKGDAHALNGSASSHYAIAGMKIPSSWRTVRVKVVPRAGVTRMKIGKIYPNHASGTVKDAIVWIRCRLYRPVGAVDIRDGAITAPHLMVDQAMVNKIVTPELLSGKIETSMFSTQAAFEGPGVRIDRGGVRISGTGQRSLVLNPSQGLQVTDYSGNATFRADMIGNVTLKGSITAGSTVTGATITGSVIRSESTSGKVEISDGRITYRNAGGQVQAIADDDGYQIWEGTRPIGRIHSQKKKGAPDVKGLAMDLENMGDYIAWGFAETANADSYTAMLTLDPKGKFYGSSRKGIHLGADLHMNDYGLVTSSGQPLKIITVTFQGRTYPAVTDGPGQNGIAIGHGQVYFLYQNTMYSLRDILRGSTWQV